MRRLAYPAFGGDGSAKTAASPCGKLGISARAMRRGLALAVLGALALTATRAYAEFEIPEVNVEQGSIEAEYRGAEHEGVPPADPFDAGDEETGLRQSHELEFQLAPTDWWMYRVTPGLTEPVGDAMQFTDLGFETQFVLKPRPGDGLGVALILGYAMHLQQARDEPSEFEVGPVIEYGAGPWLLTLNPMLTRDQGENAGPGPGLEYASQLRYRFAEHWAIAALAFGEIEDLAHSGPAAEQIHQAGPTLYYLWGAEDDEAVPQEDLEDEPAGKREASWKVGVGALFGLTPATADLSLKAMWAVDY